MPSHYVWHEGGTRPWDGSRSRAAGRRSHMLQSTEKLHRTSLNSVDPHNRTAYAPLRHRHTPCKSLWVDLSMSRAKTSGVGSGHRHSYTGACNSRQADYKQPRAHQAAVTRPTGLASRNGATSTLQVGCRRPYPLGERTPLAHCRQVGLYQSALGGCTPGVVVAVVASGRRSSFGFGATAVDSACNLCQDHLSPGIQVLDPLLRRSGNTDSTTLNTSLFECPCIAGLGGSLAVTLPEDDLLRACSGSDPAKAVLLAAFPTDRIPVVAATACLVPFLRDPAAALGRCPPFHMKVQCLGAAFLPGVSSTLCARLPPSASVVANLRLPAWSSVHWWLLRQRTDSVPAPALLPAPAPVMHMSVPVCRGAVADARLGLV